jgi:hypothetical protein
MPQVDGDLDARSQRFVLLCLVQDTASWLQRSRAIVVVGWEVEALIFCWKLPRRATNVLHPPPPIIIPH